MVSRARRSVAEGDDPRPEVMALLANIKAAHRALKTLLESCSDHWGYEDPVYRLYHGSFKVYGLQGSTERIVEALQKLAPERELNPTFLQIVREGTGKKFDPSHNRRWEAETRPIVEAFFHARYFLEMAVRYGKALRRPPQMLPSGWASVLYLFQLR